MTIYTICFTGSPCYNVSYHNYISILSCYIVIHSTIIARVVLNRLIHYHKENNLQEQLQCAYWYFHSTKLALIKVTIDILMAIDQRKLVLLVLLDLMAVLTQLTIPYFLSRYLIIWGEINGTEVDPVIPVRQISLCQS